MTLHPADRLAFDRAMVSQPVWNQFTTGADLGIAKNVLLHAGPAFLQVQDITVPILNSASIAAVYEGLAPDFDTAVAMIAAGEIRLEPAQNHDVVTPLAAVVSASMPLHVIYDAWKGAARAYAPINGGARPSLRLGLRTDVVLEHIRWLNTAVRDALSDGLAEGIALVPLAVAGLLAGDDCHGRTPVAGAALVDELLFRCPRRFDEDVVEFMRASPSLFLNLWMAATKCMMVAASDVLGSSFVTAAGGNGREVGVQMSGLPGRWFTVLASPPVGKFDVDLPKDRALGAIGDSAVIDLFGLGAMFTESDAATGEDARAAISIGTHPYFRSMDIQLGSSARTAVALEKGPVISLGIIDRLGEVGRLGGGLYDMPIDPLVAAVTALES